MKVEENMPESRFLISSQNVDERANAITCKEMTQFTTLSKVSRVHIKLLGGLMLSDIIVSCNKSQKKICLRFVSYFGPKTLKNGPMLEPTKKGPNLERYQRSRKFTSNYWVILF